MRHCWGPVQTTSVFPSFLSRCRIFNAQVHLKALQLKVTGLTNRAPNLAKSNWACAIVSVVPICTALPLLWANLCARPWVKRKEQGIKKKSRYQKKLNIRSRKIKRIKINYWYFDGRDSISDMAWGKKKLDTKGSKKCEYFFDSFICLIRVMAPGSFGTRNRTSSSSRSRSMVVVSNRRKFRSQTSDNMDR